MAFDLEIEFVGLCMFVPDSQAEAVYVLMPATCENAEKKIDPHVVRLCVDTAYLIKDSTAPTGVFALAAMDRVELTLVTTGTAATDTLPAELVTIGGAGTTSKISSVALGAAPGSMLTGRVTLRSGACSGYDHGVCWNYPKPDTPRRLCNRVTWTLAGYKDDWLDLSTTLLDGGGPGLTIPRLYPMAEPNAGGTRSVIRASLYHTTREELPPVPMQPAMPGVDDPADHFSAFYTLLAPVPADRPIPKFVGDKCPCDTGGVGGSPYTCMGAQSPAPPVPPPLSAAGRSAAG